MKTTFHGVTVEVNDPRIIPFDQQRVQAALLKYACDIHDTLYGRPESFDPPILVNNLTVVEVRNGLAFHGSIRGHKWALEILK